MVGDCAERLGREWAELERSLGVRAPAPGPGPLGSPEDRATARRIREAALDRWEELQRQDEPADRGKICDMSERRKYVVILASGRTASQWGGATDLETAKKDLRAVKRQGRTAWIEDTSGQFVPVPGATRRPNGYGRS